MVWLFAIPAQAESRSQVLDDFRDASAWRASASDQVQARLRRDGDGSLCLDYDFAGVSGYAVMRRELPLDWPARFDLTARLKSSGATNDFQFKLVDASGDNVWWANRPNAVLPKALADVKIRRRHIQFAWGPSSDNALTHTRFIEFVIAAGRDGGRGALCLASLALQERAPDPQPWPQAVVSRTAAGFDADFGATREFNGLVLTWPDSLPRHYEIEVSTERRHWQRWRRVAGGGGRVDTLFVPESEARYLRMRGARGAVASIALRSSSDWPDLNAVLAERAKSLPRGEMPRAFVGEQNYWTLVGVDGGGARSALISEDGAIELGRGGPSIEPVVQLQDGTRVTWAGVDAAQTLRDGYLPQPAVTWTHAGFTLTVEAGADGSRAAPQLLARYELKNTSARTQTYTLALVLRPWQVNPPQQFLSTPGGASVIAEVLARGSELQADARPALRFTEVPRRVTALPFDGGAALPPLLRAAALTKPLRDPQALASAAAQFSVTLAPGASHNVGFVAPLPGVDGRSRAGASAAVAPASAAALNARFDAAAAQWRERLNRTRVVLPDDAPPFADTLRSTLAQILMSRDGAALRPGTRSYARSWVRDGAMMVAGLVRLGETEAAREFVEWYSTQVFASGKVPCCVDARGADPVAENDSHGQYLYAVAEVWRHTRDRAWLQGQWPQVQRVTAYLETLRQSERGIANRNPERARYFGLLPPSISHEGYSDKSAYSYWDDFWALRGYKDATLIATELGEAETAARWANARGEFERELAQSMAATAAHYGQDHIAGAADRGDFDATSTTVALNPAQANVPAALLAATFERYWQQAQARSSGRAPWKDYTPYEWRNVGALLRLGQPERALAMADFFFGHRRPAHWNQWAEVVLPDARQARFLGDMPHAWVSSDFIRSALDLFAWEREADQSLLIGAGVLPAWRAHAVGVQGLSTEWGTLTWSLQPKDGGWRLEIGVGLRTVPGGVRLLWPGDGALPHARTAAGALAWNGSRELLLPAGPTVVFLDATPDEPRSTKAPS